MKESFTLVDVLIGTSLVLIIFVGVVGAFRLGFKVVEQSQNRIVATAIANQEIEMARNLDYESVGTQGATLPFASGDFEEISIVVRNNIEYTVEIKVKYIADSADGLAGPEDVCPNDYKKMGVKVSWPGIFGGEISLFTDIAPDNLAEECAQLGGVLMISVFDAYGEMVPSPLIEIFDPATGLPIDSATPSGGEYHFVLSPDAYKVVVSKSGYNQEQSYGEEEITTPEKPHPIIIEGEVTEMSFSIDKVSSFSVSSFSIVEEEPVVVPNAQFHLQGEKIIGYDEDEEPVYEYSQDHITDSSGQLIISDLEWDSYTFSVDPATGLDLADIVPSPQPIDLFPDTSLAVELYLDSENSLLAEVEDSLTFEPLFSATVRLFNLGLGYDETQYTNEAGQTYFIPLEVESYGLEVEAEGYLPFSGTVPVSGDATETVQLERVE